PAVPAPGPTAARAGAAAPGAPPARARPRPAGAGAATTAAPLPLPDLGQLTTAADLVRAFRTATSREASTTASAPRPCPGYPPPIATATFNGTAGYVVRADATGAGATVLVVDQR